MPVARRIAALLLIGTGIVHVVQFLGSDRSGPAIAALAFGLGYFGVGVALLGRSRAALWGGALLPGIGGVLALARMAMAGAFPALTLVLVAVDFVVAAVCAWLLARAPASRAS